MLLFPLAHPATLVSAPEQAEDGHLDVTGDCAAGGESTEDRGPGQVGLVAGSIPCEETDVSILM